MNERGSARVVLGVAASLAGLQALRYAVAEARRRSAPLRAVRVWRFAVPWYGSDAQLWRRDAADTAAATVTQAFDDAMGGVPADITVELSVVEGEPGPALVAATGRDGDLLVVGARASWWSMPLRDVTRYCVRHAACPVVVVPPPSLARQHGPRALARALKREVRGGAVGW